MPSILTEVLTHDEPFGPSSSEAILNKKSVFDAMYMSHNQGHEYSSSVNPTYIVGRRGAGKTTFLIGAGYGNVSYFIRIGSAEIYGEVNRTITEYNKKISVLVSDNACHIWEVLLTHAAMLYIARTSIQSPYFDKIWSYVSAFGNPSEMQVDDYLSRVSSEIRKSVLDKDATDSFRSQCSKIQINGMSFLDARQSLSKLVNKEKLLIRVVVDNLEELHRSIYSFEETLSALFRFAARSTDSDGKIDIPYKCQFCFPSEVLSTMYRIVANAEKDLRGRLTIEWTAREMMHLVSARFAKYIDAHDLFDRLPTPLSKNDLDKYSQDAELSIDLLRTVLPNTVINGLSIEEDPIAYIMRHTQLVPRQLIEIMNRIFSNWFSKNSGAVTTLMVINGVALAEEQSRKSVLAAYGGDYPKLEDAINILHNYVPQIFSAKELNKLFREHGVSRSGMEYEDFRESLLAVGVIGKYARTTGRYLEAEFVYTSRGVIPGISDDDRICLHPLFLKAFHDSHSIAAMKKSNVLPVYPRGSGLSDDYRIGYN